VLVDEDRFPVGVDHHQARRPGRVLVGLREQDEALALELALEHPLEQPDRARLVLQDQPVLRGVADDHVDASSAKRRDLSARGRGARHFAAR
jgi:hypothetical protein